MKLTLGKCRYCGKTATADCCTRRKMWLKLPRRIRKSLTGGRG